MGHAENEDKDEEEGSWKGQTQVHSHLTAARSTRFRPAFVEIITDERRSRLSRVNLELSTDKIVEGTRIVIT